MTKTWQFCQPALPRAFPDEKHEIARAFCVKYDQNYGLRTPRMFTLTFPHFVQLKYDFHLHMYWLHTSWAQEQTYHKHPFPGKNSGTSAVYNGTPFW